MVKIVVDHKEIEVREREPSCLKPASVTAFMFRTSALS